jgi:hypothetical protein
MITTPSFETAAQELTDLQLRVARRADQLSKKFGADPANARRWWLRAEYEVFERAERARPRKLTAEVR